MKYKQFFWRMGVIFMTISAGMGLASCNLITQNRAELASKLLQEKYNQEFETVIIGGSSIATTTFTAYSYLKTNPVIKVISFVDKDGESINDNFNIASVKYELYQYLKDQMKNSDFDFEIIVYSQFYPSETSNTDLTFQEWYLLNPNIHYQFFIFIADGDNSLQNVIKIYESFQTFLYKYNYFYGRLRVYLVEKEQYSSTVKTLNDTYYYDTNFFDLIKDYTKYQLEVDNGVSSKTLDQFVISENGD